MSMINCADNAADCLKDDDVGVGEGAINALVLQIILLEQAKDYINDDSDLSL